MNDKQLPNKQHGQIIPGHVAVTDMPMLSSLVARAALANDFMVAAHHIAMVIYELGLLAEKQIPLVRETELSVQAHWNAAVSAYGRCFVTGKGRIRLKDADAMKYGGTTDEHATLLRWRHKMIAHGEMTFRRVELFALLEPSPGRGVSELRVREFYPELPSVSELEGIHHHVATIGENFTREFFEISDPIRDKLNAEHLDRLYGLLEQGQRWPS